MSATADDIDGTIAKVQFFNGATLLGTDTTSPYSFSWTNVPAGSYTLTAKATDNGGAVSTSAAATVAVAAPLPAVSLTSPAAGSSFNDPASITLTANASITSGTITKVEFLDGAIVLATDTTSPYSAVWAGGTIGSHSLTARATSSLGAVATSPAVVISITNPAPSVSMTAPANGASFTAPANITLSANASDSNGSITKVEFFNGATLLGTDTTAPYSIVWSNVAAGSYTLTAKATDNGGAMATSVAASVTVAGSVPVVSLTSPAAGSSFNDPASIALSANASIASGTITKVEFLDGAAVVGTDTTAPYSMVWSGATIGSHSLKARATSSLATVATSSAVTISVTNPPPSVSMTSPSNGASFVTPANITLSANASDSNGSITKIEFFNGATLLGTDTAAPYSVVWNNVAVGSYTLTAKATDNGGATTVSPPVSVTVDPPANVPPTVALTAPLQAASFTPPAKIILAASASDSDGAVTQVEFYDGATLVATDTVAPYTFTWLSVPVGTYRITAKAYDDAFGSTISAPVTVTVALPPTVTLTAPADAEHFPALSNITLSADASDSDGSINQVQFYNGTTLLATDISAPYSFIWEGVAPGTYTLTARAYDDAENITTSVAHTIAVGAQSTEVTLTSPLTGASFNDPASITLAASATTTSGTITQVEFLSGGVALPGTSSNPNPDTAAPYEYTWADVPAGSYTLTARATDNNGAVTTSAAQTITVVSSSLTVALTAPLNGDSFAAPVTIALSADASALNGTITAVEFFKDNGATLLGHATETTSPYTFIWSDVPAGDYTLSARATDNFGATAVTSAISVSVAGPPMCFVLPVKPGSVP